VITITVMIVMVMLFAGTNEVCGTVRVVVRKDGYLASHAFFFVFVSLGGVRGTWTSWKSFSGLT